jgi:hypothetical protein
MDKRKRKRDIQIYQELVSHNNQSSQPANSTKSSTVSHDNVKVKISIKRRAKTRLYRESHLEMGFTWFGDDFCPSPKFTEVKYYQVR